MTAQNKEIDQTIIAQNDWPPYLEVSDEALKSYKTIGRKTVIVNDKQYSLSAHAKLTKVDFTFTKQPLTSNR